VSVENLEVDAGQSCSLRDVYAQKAISQIPRLLTLQDRNSFSPTYGCFHRRYWLDKTDDFPDALPQFGVHALALVYTHPFPGSSYYRQPKIRDWAIAGMEFWARIQHRDGSFDEFYPYERGWAGPTAFTAYAVLEAYRLLKEEVPEDVAHRVLRAAHRAALSIGRTKEAGGILANHHAIAALAVWKAYETLGTSELLEAFDNILKTFLKYHNAEEGWSLEYDGVDPGYLSATVSFLAKIYQTHPDPEIFQVLERSVEFCSYFAYPNKFYAGSVGSRNTLHFYPHGFEILAPQFPLAAAVAQHMLEGLAEGKLVPPEIMADRYVFYRVPELLQAYLDYSPRPRDLPPLPCQQEPFTRYFPQAGIYAAARSQHYVIANLAKGGVTKVFERETGRLLLNDCGIIGRLDKGQVVTSQWVGEDYDRRANDEEWEVSGRMKVVPANKYFTPLKTVIFRLMLLAIGWSPRLSHLMKGRIRKVLMLKARTTPVRFHRRFQLEEGHVILTDEIETRPGTRFSDLSLGDEFFVRYVPQSRYFQSQEMEVAGWKLTRDQLELLNNGRSARIIRDIALSGEGNVVITVEGIDTRSSWNSPSISSNRQHGDVAGGYGLDYHYGRKTKRQLIYRLGRRTDEVESAILKYASPPLQVVVDVGTADGLMLEELRRRLGALTCVGVDLSRDLLQVNRDHSIAKVQGDALYLPMQAGLTDVLVATAVIEHVPDATQMLQECSRILRKGGLLVITTPDPLMEHIATAVGLLKEAGHQRTYTLGELRNMTESKGFTVLEARKFMFSPVGFPGERRIESMMRTLHLDVIMANQLLVARKL